MEVREIMIALGGWVAGWSHVHFTAMLWSNLQVCKISSRAEIPKLDHNVAVKCTWDHPATHPPTHPPLS